MGIFDNILEFFKDGNFKKYLINETIKAYHDKPDTVKDIDKYIKDKICNGDKVSIIKFIEFFKDAINYTKWFDDNKERMESRTINKSEESKNLFDSDYTDGSVIDMLIGGDTDTDKELFEKAITKILTVLKTPSDIKDLNVLTLCVMTKINHYLAKFSFYMCVKNVKISRVNKIADIMGSFIRTDQNNLISNYENEICKLLKCNLIDLKTFVDNLPIKDIADFTGKKEYMKCMKDVSTLHDNIRTLQKNVIDVNSYNTYNDDVNNFVSKIIVDNTKYNNFVNGDINNLIKNNIAFGKTENKDIIKIVDSYNFESKSSSGNLTCKNILEDLVNVYSYLPTLEALYHYINSVKKIKFKYINKEKYDDWVSGVKEAAKATGADIATEEKAASITEIEQEIHNTYNNSLHDLITDITNNKFEFQFKNIKKIDNTGLIYDTIQINSLTYNNELHGNNFKYFPTYKNDNMVMKTVHVLCLFNKFIKPAGDPDANYQNFIKSYMKLQLYKIEGTPIDAGTTISDTDANYAKDIYITYNKFRTNISEKMFTCFKNIIQSSISSLIQYIYIINGKQYDNKLNDLVKKFGKYYDKLNDVPGKIDNINNLFYYLYNTTYADDSDTDDFVQKILTGATEKTKVSVIYKNIKALLQQLYFNCTFGGAEKVIAYHDIYNLTFKVDGSDNDVINKLTDINKIYEDMKDQIKNQIELKIKTIKDNEKEHKLKIENKLEQHINKDYIDDIKSNLFNLIRQTEERDIKTILKYEYNGKNIDVPTDDKYEKVKGQIKTYEKTLNVVENIKDKQLIENNTNFSKESTNLNSLITLYDKVKGNSTIKKENKDEICKEIKKLINTAISELNTTYTKICKYVNDNFLSGFNKFKNGLIKSTDDVVIQHVWFNALRKIHNIQSIQDIEKTEKPKNKHNILSLVNRKSTEIPKGDSQLIDKFFLNNHVPFNAANITSRINKISGGDKDDIECMNIYEQIFKRIQDILASRKIKLNAIDTERINDKIKKLKRTEKRLLEIFKTMAYYTSIPDLTRRSDVSYDDMNETIDEYKHKYEEYHKLTDNMINSLNKLNKIVTEITNNINV